VPNAGGEPGGACWLEFAGRFWVWALLRIAAAPSKLNDAALKKLRREPAV